MSALFERGKRKRLPYGQVLFVPAEDFRASIVISKKVEPTAVGRNMLRRRLYAALEVIKKEGRTGHVVFIVAPPIKQASALEATSALQDAVRTLAV